MNKKIYIDEQNRSVVVVLHNNQYRITAKGRAICHETDNFDKEKGINLANTKAWLQYYNKLSKKADKKLAYANEILDYWQKEISNLASVKHRADAKEKVIKEELDNIMKDL